MSQTSNVNINVTEVYSSEEMEQVKKSLTGLEVFNYGLRQKQAFSLLEEGLKKHNESYKRKVPGFECYIHEYKTDPFADVKVDDCDFIF